VSVCLSVTAACDGLITRALLTANFESAVDVCVEHSRWAEAVILAVAGGPQLLAETEKRFFDANKSNVNQVLYQHTPVRILKKCTLMNYKSKNFKMYCIVR